MRALVAGLATLLALAAALSGRARPDPGGAETRRSNGARLELGPGPGISGFARATAVRPFHLPADHGPHFAYQTEWWYYTGNVAATDGHRFGFQLTFFRRGLSPGPPPGDMGLSTNQVYFAHFAVTDVHGCGHSFAERFARGAGGLAGARAEPFTVWLEDWRAQATNTDGSAVRITACEGPLSLDLALRARKPLVAHGDRGLSAKGDEPGNASYYVGYTRLAAEGQITADGHGTRVSGEAWFDHEWSTSALDADAIGWDWFSLQLTDGRELMHFQIRRKEGGVEAVSGGTLVERDGSARRLSRAEVAVDVLARWTSRETGAVYPSRWRLRVPSARLDLLVEPWLEAQEMRTSFLYWEGAVRVSGSAAGRPVAGQGYAEMTGYARPMRSVF
jgi:predicted secreted hydrolase